MEFYEDVLAVPIIKGKKSKKEQFAGAFYTTTVEAYIPETGRGIQVWGVVPRTRVVGGWHARLGGGRQRLGSGGQGLAVAQPQAMDNGLALLGEALPSVMDHSMAAPYTPEQNGAAERLSRTLEDHMRALLLDAETEVA